MRRIGIALIAGAALLVTASPALAKSARCFSTDDGYYPCTFKATAKDGSFEISARGVPTYRLVIDTPGFAWGYAIYERGGRSVPLAGMFVRSRDDGACWNNPELDVKLCAW